MSDDKPTVCAPSVTPGRIQLVAPGAPPVTIHHKFIIIDAETDTPTIYTGSANMSDASQHSNDENLLEIKGDKKLAAVYMSEFLRLYEHYRARATIDVDNTLKLATTSKWADLAFKPDTPEYKARLAFCKDEQSSA